MFARIFLVLCAVHLVSSEVDSNAKGNDLPETEKLLGVDTVHDVKINKDTIITQNKVVQKKPVDKSKHAEETGPKPDWSYSSFPNEVNVHVAKFKRNMTECLKEVQANDKRPVRRLSPRTESPVHGECLIACVLKRNGVIDGKKIYKDKLLTLVGKFYAKDAKLMKKLEKNVDRCIESASRAPDECTRASQLNDCTNEVMASNKHKIVVNY